MPPEEKPPCYKDVTLPIETRVDDLVGRMTLDEKISQMVYTAPAIERLDIPAHNWWNECLHGVGRAGLATVFPQAIGLAATWNTSLMHCLATAISDEARAKHHEAARRGIRRIYSGLTFWTPNVNIFRDPRWGRGQETYGEDPYLTASMGVAFIKGLQGDDPRYLKLVATAKHYAVHSGPESQRHSFDARVSDRDLRETYLPAFEACVKEAQVESVMGAYNRTNGEPCCASPMLLGQILRGEWDFKGYVVSDCWAIIDFYQHHKVVNTPEEAAALAVREGCDLNCGITYPYLPGSVTQGLLSEADINRAVKRLFTARFRLGMFDPPEQVPYSQIPYSVINSPEHRALALQAARESIVLLKNDGLLPLSKDLKSIAVIGPNADNLRALLGNYSGTPAQAVSPLAGIRQKLSPATRLYYARGCDLADGVPTLTVIPPAYLRPASSGAGEQGLTGVYYDNRWFEGEPVLTRLDATLNFAWLDNTPLTGQMGHNFSARWTGFLVPPTSGDYTLGVRGVSSYTLYLDDQLIAELPPHDHEPMTCAQKVELEAGRLYRLRLDYMNEGLDPQVQLLWAAPGSNPLAEALEVAQKAEVVVLALGLSPVVEGEEMPIQVDGFAGGDRTDLRLPRPQRKLLKRILALGQPTVVVLLNGSALTVKRAAKQAPAIVELWYPGQTGGEALADVLFGDYNPAGRLPVTFYQSVDDLPPFEDYNMEGHTYRYFRGEPLYPFGHGLSYTTFEYSNLKLSAAAIKADETVTISVDITNTGSCPGDEVAQLYVQDVEARTPRPLKELKGFQRVSSLAPGQTKTLTFNLAAGQLALYDQGQWLVEPGLIKVMVGSSSADIRLSGEFSILESQM